MEPGVGKLSERTVVVLFLEARITTEPRRWAATWKPGPLPVGGFTGEEREERLAPAVREAVIGSPHRGQRWHLDLTQRPEPLSGGWLIGAELLRLIGLEDGTCILVLHVVVPATSPMFHGAAPPIQMAALDLTSWFGGRVVLPDRWGHSAVQQPISNPPAVAELLCAPDQPNLLPKPTIRIAANLPWNEYEYRMYMLTREALEPTEDDIEKGIALIFPIGGGTVLVGAFRSVAEGDFGKEIRLRTFAVDAVLLGVAQNVMLNRLRTLSLDLVDPAGNPAMAAALSRGVLGYRGLYAWNARQRPEADNRIVSTYRQSNALEDLEMQLTSFETAAQAAISAQTNVLLALITVLGLAVATAGAVIQGAGWKGWQTMWGVLIALATALVLLALPIGRALRSALLTWRFNR